MDKKLVQIKLSLALWDRLHAAAQADGRAITNYIKRLIECALSDGELASWKRGYEKGYADADEFWNEAENRPCLYLS